MDGRKIAELRKERKISQQKLADRLNVSRSTVAMWENNSNEPTIDSIIKMSEYFEVSIEEILSIKEKQKNSIPNEAILVLNTSEKISKLEQDLIRAYRLQPDIQPAVNRLLGIEEKTSTTYTATYIAAKSADNHEGIVQIESDRWDEMENTPKTDQDLK